MENTQTMNLIKNLKVFDELPNSSGALICFTYEKEKSKVLKVHKTNHKIWFNLFLFYPKDSFVIFLDHLIDLQLKFLPSHLDNEESSKTKTTITTRKVKSFLLTCKNLSVISSISCFLTSISIKDTNNLIIRKTFLCN